MTASAWQTIADVLTSELSDVPDLEHLVRISLRLTLASALGFVLGFEREQKGKAAGVRTHMIVAIGSALFVLVSTESGIEQTDMSRVIQGLVAGVGFLCAGTILKPGTETQQVQGLTTAAGLWLTAAIGLACGMGHEATAVLSAVLGLGVMKLVPRLVTLLERADPDIPDDDADSAPRVIVPPERKKPR